MNKQANSRDRRCIFATYGFSLSALGIAILFGCSRQSEPVPSANEDTNPSVRTGAEASVGEALPEDESGADIDTDSAVAGSVPPEQPTTAESNSVLETSDSVSEIASNFSSTPKDAETTSRVETSVLLDEWSGDTDAMPTAELLDEGWDALAVLANEGDSEAQCRLGLLMLCTTPTADRVFENVDGLDWLRKAAEKGHVLAASELAGFYSLGILVEPDAREAERLFELGVDAGDAKCLWGAGYLKLQRGDIENGLEQIRGAAEAGYSAAQVALGEFYHEGNVFERDLQEAELWYLKAAKQGHVLGQYNVGTMYYEAGDLSNAKVWLTRAADQHYADAAQNLAALYFDEGELYKAEHYVNLAIRLGNSWATQMRTGIKRQQQLEERIQESIYSTGFSGY